MTILTASGYNPCSAITIASGVDIPDWCDVGRTCTIDAPNGQGEDMQSILARFTQDKSGATAKIAVSLGTELFGDAASKDFCQRRTPHKVSGNA